MDKFLKSIWYVFFCSILFVIVIDFVSLSVSSLPEENFVTVDVECFQVLLSFAIAHGTVNTILDVLQILLGTYVEK